MIEIGPNILVVGSDLNENRTLAALLCEAGFNVMEAASEDALTALDEQDFAAAVIALPNGEGLHFLKRARRRCPGLKALLVIEPAILRQVTGDCATFVKRPFDPRQLLGCLFALVLREDEQAVADPALAAAEYGIAAAKLVCLHNRRSAAAAAGAGWLACELTRQIGETAARQRALVPLR